MHEDLAYASVRHLRHLLKNSAIGPRELVSLFAERISAHNDVSKAYITDTSALAEREADALEGTEALFGGIPFASKDLFDVKGVPTTAGSRVFYDRIADRDSTCVARLRKAGAVSLGKLNAHEFAYGATGENPHFGTCANAYDPTRIAGGSSSGSAAALAFGLAAFTLGTDTGGSVRVPAAFCGQVGLKPTAGLVPTTGVVPYCWTLDHVGIMARTVTDAADILSVIAGFDAEDPGSVNVPEENYAAGLEEGVSGLRIGIPRAFFYERCDAEILSHVEAVKRFLEDEGAKLVPVTFPDMSQTRTVSLTIQMPEALSAHSTHLRDRGDLYGEDFRAGLAVGQCILAEQYIRAKRFIARYRQETSRIFKDVDLVLTPATPIIAPKLGQSHVMVDGVSEPTGNAVTRYSTFFNMTGNPAVSVPCGMHSEGLPVSVQLVGRYFEEALVLRASRAIERNDKFAIPLPDLRTLKKQ
ncbi:aspartyl-tRNA(Asn)/glutamyl-tRNA(Gln) amidotransferase subunit A [Roseibium hamelinense]|uniref:Indoleacetamide hydrolase n=1 Tax=Roseibium hamelinense TaxID=150831 RepID=A0A562STX2_9HYPH|nr:amidase [Roseibium hamelinense]MTI43214.1 amidase [Roseibium hamelinense]TWI84735.1 aspartyl-tRNA(Asn)/glutamyl-tRNA(Gln) amidotransferase subunit A [Roseibium hamelinense]